MGKHDEVNPRLRRSGAGVRVCGRLYLEGSGDPSDGDPQGNVSDTCSVLLIYGLRQCSCLRMPGRCVRHRKVRCRRGSNGCHAPRNDHEVHHSHYYGWCARHLRTYRRCAPRLRNLWKQGLWLRTVLGLLGTRCWSVLWYGRPCCWHRYRNLGDTGVRANARQPKLFVGVILILIFAEALGLYGLIVALILSANSMTCSDITSNTYYVSNSIPDASTQCTG